MPKAYKKSKRSKKRAPKKRGLSKTEKVQVKSICKDLIEDVVEIKRFLNPIVPSTANAGQMLQVAGQINAEGMLAYQLQPVFQNTDPRNAMYIVGDHFVLKGFKFRGEISAPDNLNVLRGLTRPYTLRYYVLRVNKESFLDDALYDPTNVNNTYDPRRMRNLLRKVHPFKLPHVQERDLSTVDRQQAALIRKSFTIVGQGQYTLGTRFN